MGWKIVRDYQKEFCKENDVSGSWRISVNPINGLTKKLFEEASEWAEYYDPKELYDLRDVLNELIHLRDPDGFYATEHSAKVVLMGLFERHLEWSPDPNEKQLGYGQEIDTDP